jgi:hypothetical protein
VRPQSFAWTLFFFCLLFVTPSNAQAPVPGPRPLGRADSASAPDDAGEAQQQQVHDLAKKANLAREAALKADTDKLLKLAVELKGYVDKSNEDVLSLDVVKKADEIEKLAHSVKDKMKGPN